MTREEYLNAVAQLIRSSDRATTTGLKASTLGNLILQSLPDRWQQHGYFALKELLLDLQGRGELRVGVDAQKVLAVWAAKPTVDGTVVKAPSAFFRLKGDIWNAFVNAMPPGLRFINRTTGAVIMGQAHVPSGENGWVPIPQLSAETQKGWARELISLHGLDDLREALGEPMWHLRFSEKLRQMRPDVIPQWNRMRTVKVGEAVSTWCEQNHVARELVVDDRQRVSVVTPHAPPSAGAKAPDTVRQQVLNALARMPTSELLEIRIPAKYLFGSEHG